jgi:glycosyltransferase involved in cell wall biosynthesis
METYSPFTFHLSPFTFHLGLCSFSYLAFMNAANSLDFCLLIPCYNNLQGLLQSLKTVQYSPNQFLVVIVNDGSSEEINEEAIKLLTGPEVPLLVLDHEKNLGITAALNTGLKWILTNANTKYIARLDCGDTCEPTRFTEQVDCLQKNAELGLVGSWCEFIDRGTGENYIYKAPASHKEILREMHIRNVFIHPTIMFRADLLDRIGLYPVEYTYVEDYALCWRLIKLKQSFVIQKVLVHCEINRKGISYANRGKQLKARWRIVREFGIYKGLKIMGLLRLSLLFVLPKELILLLKKSK